MEIGIIGLGNHAINRFMPAVIDAGHRVSAVYSRKLSKAEIYAEKYGAQAFDRLDDLLGTDCEAVYVASPNALHYSQTKAVLNAGKHALLEKPMTLKYEEAVELVKLADKLNLKLAVGFHLRFHPAIEYIKVLLSNEEIGNLAYLVGRWGGFSSRPDDPDMRWWSEEELAGGGSIMGTGVHVMDSMNNILKDMPISVSAMRTPAGKILDQSSSILLRYNEVLSSVTSSRRMFLPDNSLTIFGTEGTIMATGIYSTTVDCSVFVNGRVSKRYNSGNMYQKEADGFVDYVHDAPSLIATGRDGSIVVKMTQGAIQSDAENRSINLDY